MKCLLRIDGEEHIFEASEEQHSKIKLGLLRNSIELLKVGDALNYSLVYLDASKRFVTKDGVITEGTEVTTTAERILEKLLWP